MKYNICVFFVMIFCCQALGYIDINEVMYNPDDGKEWVEFYYFGDYMII
jgi:hypothetical protein